MGVILVSKYINDIKEGGCWQARLGRHES